MSTDPTPQAIKRREQNRAACRRYRERNAERVRANGRRAYAADPAKRKASHTKWYKKGERDAAV